MTKTFALSAAFGGYLSADGVIGTVSTIMPSAHIDAKALTLEIIKILFGIFAPFIATWVKLKTRSMVADYSKRKQQRNESKRTNTKRGKIRIDETGAFGK